MSYELFNELWTLNCMWTMNDELLNIVGRSQNYCVLFNYVSNTQNIQVRYRNNIKLQLLSFW